MFRPVEIAAIDDDAADGRAVPADVFSERMYHNVHSVFDGTYDGRRGNGVVTNDGNALRVGGFSDGGEVTDVARRVTDTLAVNTLRFIIDQGSQILRAIRFSKANFDAQLRQHVRKQGVGTAVELRRRNDVVARRGKVDDGVVDRRTTRTDRQPRDASLERGDALFEHIDGGVHDATVDVAGYREVEQVGTVLGVVELVGNRLVDRHGNRLGRRFGFVARVDG